MKKGKESKNNHKIDIHNLKEIKEKKSFKTTIYLVLRILVIITAVRQFFNGNYSAVFLCGLTLILFLIPNFVEKNFNVDLPDTLEIIIYLFIFSAEILGEINSFYLHFEYWDDMLHTLNGFLMTAIGFALIDILNKKNMFHQILSPVFVCLMAFSFSMTTGVVWEFVEYGIDQYLGFDMQKDTVLDSITSIDFDETKSNTPITIPIKSLEINGEDWTNSEFPGGYLDIGLHDTMSDLFVNFIGAIIFCFIGWFYLVGENKAAESFIPKRVVKQKNE